MAFPFLPVLLSLGGLGALAKSTPSATGTVPKTLTPFKWYRVRFTTPVVPGSPSPIAANNTRVRVFDLFTPGTIIPFIVLERLKALGFDQYLYAFGDAQTGSTWDAYARFRGPGPTNIAQAGVLVADEILHTNPLAPSPPLLSWIGPYKQRITNNIFSDGPMNPELSNAIAYAITHDDDTSRLNDFSISMQPEYTTAAGLLTGKRDSVLEARKGRYTMDSVLALRASDAMAKATGTAGVGSFWDVAAAIATGGATEIIPIIADIVTSIADTIADIGRKVLEIIKTAAPFIQMGLSFIPGIGTVASAALGAGIALAEGRPITDALLEAARGAFPGGPIAAKAVETAIRTVVNLASGESLDAAFLDGLRSSLSPTERMALDATVAIAQGKKIQDIALGAVGSFSPAAGSILKGIADGKPIDFNLVADATAAQAGLSPDARAALRAVTSVAQGGNITDAAAQAARSKLPPSARANFDAALAIAQKRDPRAAVIQGAQSLVPNSPEAQTAMSMTRSALQGVPTPATLAGDATKFIPNLPANRGVNPGQISQAEASRLSDLGQRAFTHPVLYLPNGERQKIEKDFREQDEAANRQAQAVAKTLEQQANLRAALQQVAITRALNQAFALREQVRNSWVPFYANMKRTTDRGNFP